MYVVHVIRFNYIIFHIFDAFDYFHVLALW